MEQRICTVHTNSESLDLCLTYEQMPASHYPLKAVGLWYSFNNEWLQWCKEEEHRSHWISQYTHKLEFDRTRILHITNPKELRWFNDKYGIQIFDRAMGTLPEKFIVLTERTMGIDWNQVTREYAGIEFINFHAVCASLFCDFQLYINIQWYQMLSMDSGCIWDLSVVKSVESITEEQSFNDAQSS